MTENPDRRDAAKAVAAAGALLLLGGQAPAGDPEEPISLAGEWFNGGKLDQPCAVFQQGRVLLLINEKGDFATAKLTEANKFTILKGWEEGVVGTIIERGRVIAWKGGGNWKKR
jgi:hypothetical protein